MAENFFDESEYEEVSPDEIESSSDELKKDKKQKKEDSAISNDGSIRFLNGLSKSNCPSYISSKNELMSPRGRMLLLKNNKASITFYNCSLCGACSNISKPSFEESLRKVREKLVRAGRETKANRQMIENIRKYGNPYGKLRDGETPEVIYT